MNTENYTLSGVFGRGGVLWDHGPCSKVPGIIKSRVIVFVYNINPSL